MIKNVIKQLILFLLTEEAKYTLKRHKPFIVVVSGNVGKTSTKDAVAAVLSTKYDVRKSQKSLNSDFGVPLTILGEKSGWNNPLEWLLILGRGAFVPFDDDYPTHLVLELGADKPGDIASLASWITPDIAVLTQFGDVPVHVEFFENRHALVEEEVAVAKNLKEEGLFIYAADDHDSVGIEKDILARKCTIGIEKDADVRARVVEPYGTPLTGTRAQVLVGTKEYPLELDHVLGKSPVYAALSALAVGLECGVAAEVALATLKTMPKPPGRMRILEGMNGTTIIDDTYNASPKATEHGLHTLDGLRVEGRKIAVLGDMLELGHHTKEEHYRIGQVAGKICHELVVVGIRSRFTGEGALDAGLPDGHVHEYDTAIEAGKDVVSMIAPGDVLYIKGSQSMRMERIVSMLLESSHDPSALLVRQEKEWLRRT